MAIPRNLANLANQLNTDGEAPKIEVGDSKVEVTDTGSNGTIVFNTDGSERMRVDSSGNVGVGTTDASGAKLRVLGRLFGGNGADDFGRTNSNGGGMINTTAWSAAGSSHTFTFAEWGGGSGTGDNFSGFMIISGTRKVDDAGLAKSALITAAINKIYGQAVSITQLTNTKQNMTTFSVTNSSNSIVVTTDANCQVCIVYIGAK